MPGAFKDHAKTPALEKLIDLLTADVIPVSYIRTAFWIAKALVFRFDSINAILPLLTNLLRRSDCGSYCARGFSILLAPDEIVSQENGAIVRKLAKQRVFSLYVSHISTLIRQADASTRSNYLIALSGILQHVPEDVMATELRILLPLLLQSLGLEDMGVRSATIESLTVIVRTNPAVVAEHATSLVKSLLEASSDTQRGTNVNSPFSSFSRGKATNSFSKHVRFNALKCLGSFPGNMSDSTLLPSRDMVTYGLSEALDDRRREVRMQAIDCKASWLKLDEPDED